MRHIVSLSLLLVCSTARVADLPVSGPSATIQAAVPKKPDRTIYVDCLAAPGGDGTRPAPFHSITASLPTAKVHSVDRRVTIDVAEGVCDEETFPINLDFPVWVRGSRSPGFDDQGWPVDDQTHDTLVTWIPSGAVGNIVFIRITAPDVWISKLSLDGQISPGPDLPLPPRPGPTGVSANRAREFEVRELRIVRMQHGVRAEGASGLVTDSYFGDLSQNALFLSGGEATSPPTVACTNNRIQYNVNAIALAGAGAAGTDLRVIISDNDLVTSMTDTGPANPAALRMSPMVAAAAATVGTVEAIVERNRIRGTAKHGILVHAGQPSRRPDGLHYTGSLAAAFADNVIEETVNPSLITFTNARATALPCELNPAIPLGPDCPLLMGPLSGPWTYWEYLEHSAFHLWHSGELDGALIDHPELDPVDGRLLDNLLVIDDEVVDYETFVVVPR